MTANPDSDLLDRVRKLLAKAEDEGCTPAEAEALTAKAAELMARYGIDRALLGALHPETDRPADRKFGFERPWADVKAHLLAALATALRCQCVQTHTAEGRACTSSATPPTWNEPRSSTPPSSSRWPAPWPGSRCPPPATARRPGAARGCSATARRS